MFEKYGKAPRKYRNELTYLIGKKDLGLFFKESRKKRLENAHIIKGSTIKYKKNVTVFEITSLFTIDEKYMTDTGFLVEQANKLKEIEKQGDFSDEELVFINNLLALKYNQAVPIPLFFTNGVQCYMTKINVDESKFKNQKMSPNFVIDFLCHPQNESFSLEQINVYKYLELNNYKITR